MVLLLKLAGFALCGGSVAVAVAAAPAEGPAGVALATAIWTAMPVFVAGAMLAVFAEVVAHVRSIERAVSAQYALLAAHRRPEPLPARRIGPR